MILRTTVTLGGEGLPIERNGKLQLGERELPQYAWRAFDEPTETKSLNALVAAPAPVASKEVYGLHGWRRLVLFPLGLAVRLWGMSLRFDVGAPTLRNLDFREHPVAFILWHNRLFLTPEVSRRYRKGRKTYGLVSASKDGAWLEAFFELVGIRAVRGSSSRFGREAALALVEVLRANHDVGITPDGPRGPLYDFKAGGLIVARRAHAALLLLGGAYESAWQLGSWDRFYLPKPFSRVRIYCELVPAEELTAENFEVDALKRRLVALSPDGSSDSVRVI